LPRDCAEQARCGSAAALRVAVVGLGEDAGTLDGKFTVVPEALPFADPAASPAGLRARREGLPGLPGWCDLCGCHGAERTRHIVICELVSGKP